MNTWLLGVSPVLPQKPWVNLFVAQATIKMKSLLLTVYIQEIYHAMSANIRNARCLSSYGFLGYIMYVQCHVSPPPTETLPTVMHLLVYLCDLREQTVAMSPRVGLVATTVTGPSWSARELT